MKELENCVLRATKSPLAQVEGFFCFFLYDKKLSI